MFKWAQILLLAFPPLLWTWFHSRVFTFHSITDVLLYFGRQSLLWTTDIIIVIAIKLLINWNISIWSTMLNLWIVLVISFRRKRNAVILCNSYIVWNFCTRLSFDVGFHSGAGDTNIAISNIISLTFIVITSFYKPIWWNSHIHITMSYKNYLAILTNNFPWPFPLITTITFVIHSLSSSKIPPSWSNLMTKSLWIFSDDSAWTNVQRPACKALRCSANISLLGVSSNAGGLSTMTEFKLGLLPNTNW